MATMAAALLAGGTLLVAGAPPAGAVNGSWTQETAGMPPSTRSHAASAYDAAHHVVIVFGGQPYTGLTELADTWAWDGTTHSWSQKQAGNAVGAPPGRTDAAMAFDPASGTVVMFGGASAGTPLGDTWTWNGSTWSQQPAVGPSPRAGAAMAFDASSGHVVLFGGHDSTTKALGDTWSWDGTAKAWTQLNVTSSPPARTGTSMVSFGSGGALLSGGADASGAPLGDTWLFQGGVWTNKTPSGANPAPRQGAGLSFDSSQGVAVLFGGYGTPGCGAPYRDTWTWDGSTWTAQNPPAPLPAGRAYATMTYDPESRSSLLYDGLWGCGNSQIQTDAWTFQTTSGPPNTTTTSSTTTTTAPPPPVPEDANVAYGPDTTNQVMDVYYVSKSATTPRPVVLMIHGGAWGGGDKYAWEAPSSVNNWDGYAQQLALANPTWVVASMNYRMGGQRWTDEPADVDAAVQWLRSTDPTKGGQYSIDPTRVGLIGESAGAHLGLLEGVKVAGSATPIRAVASWSAPSDLTQLATEEGCADVPCDNYHPGTDCATVAGCAVQAYVGGCLVEQDPFNRFWPVCPDRYTNGSPTTYVSTADSATKLFLLHSPGDPVVPYDQYSELARDLDGVGVPYTTATPGNACHALSSPGGSGGCEGQTCSITSSSGSQPPASTPPPTCWQATEAFLETSL
jgi:acetyl esterase/lipase